MLKRTCKKAISVIVTLAMVCTMVITFATAYTPTGTMTTLYNSGNAAASGTYYSISSATEMGYFASYVSSGKNTSGVTFYLTQDITLSGSWTPVGDATNHFNGKFDGCSHTLSGLSVSFISGRAAYYGVFGYATGAILNLKVNGSISLGTNTVDYVGGIVGYTTSDVYNCQTNVAITGTNASQVGGVVGAIENTATSAITHPFHVQACSAKGNISALKRAGGVVGAVYCSYAGNVIVDNCLFASGSSTRATLTVSYTSKVWSGGVVGYCRGYVTNCYAIATLSSTGAGHYICGIAGILQGTGPQASMSNSYGAVSFNSNCNTGYDRPLEGSVDNSNALPITSCLYDSTLAGSFTNTNPIPTGGNSWGYWTNTGSATTAIMKSTSSTTSVYSSNGTTYNTTSATALNTLGSAFESDSSSRNDGYPVLAWQNDTNDLPAYVPGNGAAGGATETGIFLDGVNGSDSNGGTTITAPVKSLSKALQLAGTSSTIYVINTVTLTGSGTELNLDGGSYDGATIKRSATFSGVLFNVPSNATVTVSGVAVNGNKGNVLAAYSLFNVIGGSLTVGTDAVLRDNYCSDGGAINVSSGTAAQSSGTLTGNESKRGGAVYVVAGGTFSMSGGSITANESQNVGGAICTRGTVTMSGGTIGGSSGNANTANYGGGVAIMDDGSMNMSAGSITYNTATTNGGGVYVGPDASYSSTGTVSNNTPQNVYYE